jgi:hypothetical protein
MKEVILFKKNVIRVFITFFYPFFGSGWNGRNYFVKIIVKNTPGGSEGQKSFFKPDLTEPISPFFHPLTIFFRGPPKAVGFGWHR